MSSLIIYLALGFFVFAGKAEPSAELKSGLNSILTAVNGLHSALFAQDKKQIDTSIEAALKEVKKCQGLSGKEYHLKRILDAMATQLEKTRMKTGEEKLKPLREVFRQAIQITRSYKTDRYKIFFCEKDRAVWLQKSWRAKNPFMPKGKTCGVLVR